MAPQLPIKSFWYHDQSDHVFVDIQVFTRELSVLTIPKLGNRVWYSNWNGVENFGNMQWWVFCPRGSNWWSPIPDVFLYRVELNDLIAIIYNINWICLHYQVKSGIVKYHCYNKGALTNLFFTKFLTILQFLNTDYNLILIAKNLVTLLPVTIVSEWVKGHYKGDNREYKGKDERLAKRFSKTKR